MLAGRFMRPGVPLTRVMAHLHVIGVDVIATVGWSRAGPECFSRNGRNR